MTSELKYKINALVGEKVMGWRWYHPKGTNGMGEKVFHFAPADYKVPDHWRGVTNTSPAGKKNEVVVDMGSKFYSTDIATAADVVDAVCKRLVAWASITYSAHADHGFEEMKCRVSFISHENASDEWQAEADTVPLAICLAALKAFGVELPTA